VGLGLPALNWLVLEGSIERAESAGMPAGVTGALKFIIWTFAAIGAWLVLAGLGLLAKTRWGRILSIAWLPMTFLGLLAAGGASGYAQAAAELEYEGPPVYLEVVTAVPACSPLYGVLLTVVLLLPASRDWARGVGARKRGIQPGEAIVPAAAAPVYAPAVVSLVLSLVPFLLLTQMASLVVGLFALRKIKRSGGALGGRGYALAGVVVSSLILAGIGSLVGLIVVVDQMQPEEAYEMVETPSATDESTY
jgi:hypothetical protein